MKLWKEHLWLLWSPDGCSRRHQEIMTVNQDHYDSYHYYHDYAEHDYYEYYDDYDDYYDEFYVWYDGKIIIREL